VLAGTVGRRGLPTVLASVLVGLIVVECGVPPPVGPPVAVAAVAAAQAAGEVAPPARIRLPSLDVDAAVVAVGVDDRGEMAVPVDIRETGWYRFGPAPGSTTGSAVLSGHVDDYRQGAGVFARIGDLGPGDPVRHRCPGRHRAVHCRPGAGAGLQGSRRG